MDAFHSINSRKIYFEIFFIGLVHQRNYCSKKAKKRAFVAHKICIKYLRINTPIFGKRKKITRFGEIKIKKLKVELKEIKTVDLIEL